MGAGEMIRKDPSLTDARNMVRHEVSAKKVLSSRVYRASLLSQYGLPNMEDLWLLLVKAALCKWEDLHLSIEAVASQIGLPVAIVRRLTNVLADAKLISIKTVPTTGTELEITQTGEELVIHGLQMEQSLADEVAPMAIPLSR